MEPMARKDAAREIAVAAGVPVVPSYDASTPEARPGTTRCWSRPQRAAAARACASSARRTSSDAVAGAAQREARAAFGDDTLLLEKYVERRPAHRGPGAGGRATATSCTSASATARPSAGTRRCSRRRPRRRSATACARARDLVARSRSPRRSATSTPARSSSCSTRDDRRGVLPGDEHPAPGRAPGHRAGRPASTSSSSSCAWPRASRCRSARTTSTVHGHAIEARVYAEDPFGGFLPQAGTRGPGPLADRRACGSMHALESGQVVSTAYDPMLGKVIAHGPDREAARRALVRRTRRDRHPRPHHQRRLPPRPGRLRGDSATPRSTPRGSTAPRSRRRTPRQRGSSAPGRRPGWTRRASPSVAVRRLADRRGPARRPTSTSTDRSSSTDAGGSVEIDGQTHEVGMVSAEHHVVQLIIDGAPHRRGRQRAAARRRGGAPRPAVRVRAGPTCSRSGRDRGRRDAGVADAGHRPRRPGRRGRRRGGGPGARRDRGDEDGAQPQGAVRRHRHVGGLRGPGTRSSSGDTSSSWRRADAAS